MGNSAITGINLGVPAFQQNFANGDLTAGVLTVTHNLNSQYVSVTVFNNNDLLIIPDDVDATGTTALTIDLTSYGALTGTWRAIIVNTGANVNNIASDLNLTGQAAEDFAIFSGSVWQAKGGTEKIGIDQILRTMSVATGTVAYTGLGFKPSSIHFLGSVGLVQTPFCTGFDNGSVKRVFYVGDGGVATFAGTSSFSIFLETAIGASQRALVSSMDSDGFTLSWTKVGSPTGTGAIYFHAFR